MSDLTVVFPVFNKQNSVRAVYDITCNTIRNTIGCEDYQLIFVDDASTDDSVALITELAKQDYRVKLLRHSANKGQVKSLETGLHASTGTVVFFATCDLQNPLESIAPIYRAIAEQGHDLGVAYREQYLDKSWQSAFSRIFFYFLRIIFPTLPHGGFDYGAMHHTVSDKLKEVDFDKILIQLEVFRYAKRPYFHPIVRTADALDNSGWSNRQKVTYALRFIQYMDARAWTRVAIVGVALLGMLCLVAFLIVLR